MAGNIDADIDNEEKARTRAHTCTHTPMAEKVNAEFDSEENGNAHVKQEEKVGQLCTVDR